MGSVVTMASDRPCGRAGSFICAADQVRPRSCEYATHRSLGEVALCDGKGVKVTSTAPLGPVAIQGLSRKKCVDTNVLGAMFLGRLQLEPRSSEYTRCTSSPP